MKTGRRRPGRGGRGHRPGPVKNPPRPGRRLLYVIIVHLCCVLYHPYVIHMLYVIIVQIYTMLYAICYIRGGHRRRRVFIDNNIDDTIIDTTIYE